MNFVSIRIVTADVARLVDFYEQVTGVPAAWSTPDFAEVRAGAATLAIASTRTVPDAAPAGGNGSVIIEFLTGDAGDAGNADDADDVDGVHRRLAGVEVVNPPTTMPWGNRSLLLRDPDGNLVNVFTPVTPAAVAKFAAVRGPH
jgi:catechol 2,3-dioxygenase-like lactoylglutathione lyase family enzyme